MNDFPYIPATTRSLLLRKPVFGIGINDAPYIVQPIINGKRIICPYYLRWRSMFVRCYDAVMLARRPKYSDCIVDERWLLFSEFKKWMMTKNWEGMQLDKDILVPGNHIYGPEGCCFISHSLNSVLNDCAKKRGRFPQGVNFEKRCNKFKAQINIDGEKVHLGLFETPEQAEAAYLSAKAEEIIRVVYRDSKDPRIIQSIENIANEMRHKLGI